MASMPVFLLLLLLLGTAEVASANTSLPGCPEKCGNITIPYPFGIGPNCSLEGFEVTCNHSKPFMGTSNIELIDVNLTTRVLRVHFYNYRNCLFGSNSTDNTVPQMNYFLDGQRNGVTLAMLWAVGSISCEKDMLDTTSYLCRSENSECFDTPDYSNGYYCSCSAGYEGNPYIPNGCRGTDHEF
uniref:Wall-associated receptor kinase 2-like n=1 Tax=Elaeis guineensis var. tenera TaxID=51953 RepID=A0A8N4FC19_ELAGV|nr:wall-associated receptor kinase 2-like [Elaeis guineensis]